METLLIDYERVLKGLSPEDFPAGEDKYSGVFLPVAFDEYRNAPCKVMHVGRETSGWNTKPNKHTLARIFAKNATGCTHDIVAEAVSRYEDHLKTTPAGKIITTSTSKFRQYFFRIAKELGVSPKAVIYANLFAWDYAGKSPLTRPPAELAAITKASIELLAIQIISFKPNYIIFSTGFRGVDTIIKKLFDDHLGGYTVTKKVEKHRLWEFEGRGAICYRIAHPRATHGHGEFRDEVIRRIKIAHATRQAEELDSRHKLLAIGAR